MIIRFWHHKGFPIDLRGTFELPEWPYFHGDYGPVPDVLKRFCQNLGIVRIEVEKKVTKLFVPTHESDPVFEERGQWAYSWKPWNGFVTSGNFDDSTLMIRAWNPNAPKFAQKVTSGGAPDNFAWYYWNRRVRILAMDDEMVKYSDATQEADKQPRKGVSQAIKGPDKTGKWIN